VCVCVALCNIETTTSRQTRPNLGCRARERKKVIFMLNHSSFCVLNFMLPARRSNFAEAARTTRKGEYTSLRRALCLPQIRCYYVLNKERNVGCIQVCWLCEAVVLMPSCEYKCKYLCLAGVLVFVLLLPLISRNTCVYVLRR
jgi:hypothetical protein